MTTSKTKPKKNINGIRIFLNWSYLRFSFTLMVIIFAFVLWWTACVVPRKCVVIVLGFVDRVYGAVDSGAGGACGVIEWSIDRTLRADTLAIGAAQSTPAAVWVVQAFRTLIERAAWHWTLAFIRLGKHESAHSTRAIYRLVSGRYTLAQISRPSTLREPSLASVWIETGLAVVIRVTSIRTLFALCWTKTLPPRLLRWGASPIK